MALLLILFDQELFGSICLSLTADEPIHIALGYTELVLGDYEHMPLHEPPLINQWSALPLLFRSDRPDPRQMSNWESRYPPSFSVELLQHLGSIEATELAARVPVMLLSLLLAAIVFRWAGDLFGPRAGLLALFLLVFDPNIIAHSQLATTDVGGLTFGFLALYCGWRTVRRPTRGHIVLTGVALGLAVAAKVSGSFYALMLGLLVVLSALAGRTERPRDSLGRWLLRLLAIYGLAFLVFWACYRFQVGEVEGLPFPVPGAAHFDVVRAFREHVAAGHRAFAAGQVSQQGWWWYFPLALAIKTPLPALLLIVPAVIAGVRASSGSWLDDVWLLAFPLAYLASSMASTINIGYRHLLPLLPFLYILISRLSTTRRTAPRFALVALLLWHLVGTVTMYPHYLAFFNELAGGPGNGYRYLADSNTDWGQALKALAAYQRREGIDEVQLAMFSHLDPAVYGVRYQPLPPLGGTDLPVFVPSFNPPPGDYVISATTLQGIACSHPEMYDWFRRRVPDAIIGRVMFLYRVQSERPPRNWVIQCARDATPLDAFNLSKGFGRSDLRLADFDCASSWVLPGGGTSPGWLVLAGEPPDWLVPRLDALRLSYQSLYAGDSSPLRIYEVDGPGTHPDGGQAWLLGAGQPLEEALSAPAQDLPLALDEHLTLLGYTLDQEGGALETTWQVENVPQEALTLRVRLLGPGGDVIASAQGLGLPVVSWQAGDLLLQRHPVHLPEDAPPGEYWIQIVTCQTSGQAGACGVRALLVGTPLVGAPRQ